MWRYLTVFWLLNVCVLVTGCRLLFVGQLTSWQHVIDRLFVCLLQTVGCCFLVASHAGNMWRIRHSCMQPRRDSKFADQICYLTQSLYTYIGPSSHRADSVMPGVCSVGTRVSILKFLVQPEVEGGVRRGWVIFVLSHSRWMPYWKTMEEVVCG